MLPRKWIPLTLLIFTCSATMVLSFVVLSKISEQPLDGLPWNVVSLVYFGDPFFSFNAMIGDGYFLAFYQHWYWCWYCLAIPMLINTLIDTIYKNSLQKLDMTQKDVKGFRVFFGCQNSLHYFLNDHKGYLDLNKVETDTSLKVLSHLTCLVWIM